MNDNKNTSNFDANIGNKSNNDNDNDNDDD